MNRSASVSKPELVTVRPDQDPALFLAAVEAYGAARLTAGEKPLSVSKATNTLKKIAREVGGPIWSSEDIEARAVRRIKSGIRVNTRRYEQITVEQFCDFLLDPRYSWAQRFRETYEAFPIQPIHDGNRTQHVEPDENEQHVRCVTTDELRALFAHCDSEARNAVSPRSRRIALRDSAMFKFAAGYGLRVMEVADARLSACAPAEGYGNFGSIRIFGKSKKFGTKRPRTVYTIGHYRWVSDVLRHHVDHIMPLFTNGDGDRLFVNEDGRELDPRYISRRFSQLRDAAGLPKAVTAHGMRRLWATTLALAGVEGWYISNQLGHESPATTQSYILIPQDFIVKTVRRHQESLLTL